MQHFSVEDDVPTMGDLPAIEAIPATDRYSELLQELDSALLDHYSSPLRRSLLGEYVRNYIFDYFNVQILPLRVDADALDETATVLADSFFEQDFPVQLGWPIVSVSHPPGKPRLRHRAKVRNALIALIRHLMDQPAEQHVLDADETEVLMRGEEEEVRSDSGGLPRASIMRRASDGLASQRRRNVTEFTSTAVRERTFAVRRVPRRRSLDLGDQQHQHVRRSRNLMGRLHMFVTRPVSQLSRVLQERAEVEQRQRAQRQQVRENVRVRLESMRDVAHQFWIQEAERNVLAGYQNGSAELQNAHVSQQDPVAPWDGNNSDPEDLEDGDFDDEEEVQGDEEAGDTSDNDHDEGGGLGDALADGLSRVGFGPDQIQDARAKRSTGSSSEAVDVAGTSNRTESAGPSTGAGSSEPCPFCYQRFADYDALAVHCERAHP